jgi:hypothetical protein
MAQLIIHVGPGKCGSSSIQSFFLKHKKACKQKVRFIQLERAEIFELNSETASESIRALFEKEIRRNLARCEVLILSHELLFQCPLSIKNICDIGAPLAAKISIIGYCRRQADFQISAYSQWLFRSPERVKEVLEVVRGLQLDPMLFSGLERQLIAAIATDFHSARQIDGATIFDWNQSYRHISQLVRRSGAGVQCGLIPSKESGQSLVQDFCQKVGLTLRPSMHALSFVVVNVSFNPDFVEAINNAVVSGLAVPGPHDSNKRLQQASMRMGSAKKDVSEFVGTLTAYIASCYTESNRQLCEEYGLDAAYFDVGEPCTKAQMLEFVRCEHTKRALAAADVMAQQRRQLAKLTRICLDYECCR